LLQLFVLVGDVDKLKNVHVFLARGARWKRLRMITNPTFTVNNLKRVSLRLGLNLSFWDLTLELCKTILLFQIMPIIDDTITHFLAFMEKFAESGKAFDIHKYILIYGYRSHS
jgi:hypothetical protein